MRKLMELSCFTIRYSNKYSSCEFVYCAQRKVFCFFVVVVVVHPPHIFDWQHKLRFQRWSEDMIDLTRDQLQWRKQTKIQTIPFFIISDDNRKSVNKISIRGTLSLHLLRFLQIFTYVKCAKCECPSTSIILYLSNERDHSIR